MTFQLVRASDEDIAVWQTEHGHIYGFSICRDTDSLKQIFTREAPDAAEPAAHFAEDARDFATAEARARQLIGRPAKRRRRTGCSAEMA